MRIFGIGVSFLVALAGPVFADDGYFDLQPGVTLVSGETWKQNGETYRLYGIQSCLRGTFFTPDNGRKTDCGDSAIAVLAAYIKDTAPKCAPVARTETITYVSCYLTLGENRMDLGTVLVSTGWAFASLDRAGSPYQMAYLVTEQAAKDDKRGLWRFPDLQHPSILVSSQAEKATTP